MLGSAFDLLQVILGFSLIIVVHELGHFLAARWAGIRVLAFAVGFGPALFSYRRGFGFRSGSSEADFRRRVKNNQTREVGGDISPTEYRLNVLPLGGYVKMLGQDDADPTAVSDAPDSYQKAPPWKRMIVISAGVVMNILLAAVLFCGVFLVGLKAEAARIGEIDPDGPVAQAAFIDGPANVEPRVLSTDRILSLDGKSTDSFNDVVLATAMARGGREIDLLVEREGVSQPLLFRVTPRESTATRALELGISQMASTTLVTGATPRDNEMLVARWAEAGLAGLQPGMTLVEVQGSAGTLRPATSVYDLFKAAEQSDGSGVRAVFESPNTGARVEVTVPCLMDMSVASVPSGAGTFGVPNVLGLSPVVRVEQVDQSFETAKSSGFQPGDIIARVAGVSWPSVAAAMQTIRGHAGKTISAEVLRKGPGGEWTIVDLPKVGVNSRGQIGLGLSSTASLDEAGVGAIVGAWPQHDRSRAPTTSGKANDPSARAEDPTPLRDRLLPGSRIVSVNGVPVRSLRDVREQLVKTWSTRSSSGVEITLQVELPPTAADAPTREAASFVMTQADADSLARHTWVAALSPFLDFEPQQVVLKESDPLSAVKRGVHETHTVMMTAYVSFLRLVQGTVKVEHLKGPVGIAHIGTVVAKRGPTWLIFFLAIISVNLAVVNFLPVPITDGGHFLFLVYEAISGKPPPIAVQNAAMLAGMILLGAAFLFVFVNDIIQLTK